MAYTGFIIIIMGSKVWDIGLSWVSFYVFSFYVFGIAPSPFWARACALLIWSMQDPHNG